MTSRNLELALRIQADLGEANAALDQFTQKIDHSGQAAVASSAKLNTVAISAKQTANAMRMVPAQMTDIVTQVAGGQNPFLIMIQQGGQMKDMFGGIGPMMRGLAGAITPVGAAVAATTITVGALAVAYYQGSQEATAFANANAMTNNYIGMTVNQLSNLSRVLGAQVGSQHAAAAALAEMASTGKIAGGAIDQIAIAAVKMEKTTGKAIKDTVREYAALADEPVKASLKLNESYHFLTLSVYEQIVALEKRGDKEAAAEIAQKSLAEAQIAATDKVRANLGYLEEGWKTLGEKANGAWDAMLGIGRENTLETKIGLLQNRIKRFDTTNPEMAAKLRVEQAGLQEMLRLERRGADVQKAQQAAQEDAIDAARLIDQLEESTATNAEKRTKALEKYHLQLEKIRAVNPDDARVSPERVARVEANINKKYETKPVADPVKNAYAQQTLELTKQLDAAYRGLDAAQSGVAFQEGKASDNLAAWLELNHLALKLSPDEVTALKLKADQIDRVAKATADLTYVEGLHKKAQAIGKTEEQQLADEISGRKLSPELDAEARKEAADISLKNDAETLKKLNQQMLQASGQTVEAQSAMLMEKYSELMTRLAQRGDEAGLEKINNLFNIELDKGKIDALKTQVDNIFTQQSITETGIQTDIQARLITEAEARQKLLELRKTTGNQVAALLPEMERLAIAEYNATGSTASLKNLDAIKQKLNDLKKVTSELEVAFKGAFTSSMAGALADLTKGTKDLGEAAASFADGIANAMLNFASQQMAEAAYSGLASMAKGALAPAATASPVAAVASTAVSGVATDASATAAATSLAGVAVAAAPLSMAFGGVSLAADSLMTALYLAAQAEETKAATSAIGFSSGGFTGFGGKYEPAGIVHKMEHVTRSEIVRQPGALAFLDQFNRVGMAALPGYANGGLVGVPRITAPIRPAYQLAAMPAAQSGGSSTSLGVYNYFDLDALTQALSINRQFEKVVVQHAIANGGSIKQGWQS